MKLEDAKVLDDLLNNIPGEAGELTIAQLGESSIAKWSKTKVEATYTRTIQVRQFEPLSPSVTVTLDLFDSTAISDAIRSAMSDARNGVMEAFAYAIPSVAKQIGIDFITDLIAKATPEQIAAVRAALPVSEGAQNVQHRRPETSATGL